MRILNLLSKPGMLLTTILPLAFGIGKTVLPDPTGPHHVSLHIASLTDHSRTDPFDPDHGPRKLMVSLFHPLPLTTYSQAQIVPYLPSLTAAFEDSAFSKFGIPNGTFSSLFLRTYVPAVRPKVRRTQFSTHITLNQIRKYPVILFSPALGTSRLFYNAIAMAVASEGFLVVTIDHPHDADIVEFPSGPPIYLSIDTDKLDQILLAVDTRVADASFVLDQLSNISTIRHVLPDLAPNSATFDVERVGMFGHSLGGAASASAMLRDSRIIGGLNLDGTFFGPVVEKGLDNPFLLFGQATKTQDPDPSWTTIWPNLRSWKLQLGLEQARHYTFSDLPYLVSRLGLQDRLPGAVKEGYLGYLDGERALDIVRSYVEGFFSFVLKGIKSELLEGESKCFPEVEFVKKGQ